MRGQHAAVRHLPAAEPPLHGQAQLSSKDFSFLSTFVTENRHLVHGHLRGASAEPGRQQDPAAVQPGQQGQEGHTVPPGVWTQRETSSLDTGKPVVLTIM